MDLSIIIVNWNTRELLAGCLRSVFGSQLPAVSSRGETGSSALEPTQPSLPFTSATPGLLAGEVIVVDNASTDGSARMVREQFPWVRVIENTENVGFARANNQGIGQSQGRYVVLLNSDTEVHAGAFDTLVAFLDTHPSTAGCGPRLLNADGSLQPSCHPILTPGREFWRLVFLDRFWRRATYAQQRWGFSTPRRVEVIKGACLILRREALAQVGLLDERYFMYTEEMDLCYRLLRAGWELWWVPQALVTHYGEASSKQVADAMYLELYRSKAQFQRKFGGERAVRRFRRLLWLAYAPRWAVAAVGSSFVSSLASRAHTYRRLLSALSTL